MNRRKFIIGVTLIFVSSAGGWIALGLGGMLAVKYGERALKIGTWLYILSWIPFVLGFLLSGKEGVAYSKEIMRKLFRRKDGGGGPPELPPTTTRAE